MMKDARAFGRSNPTGYLPAARKTDGHAGVVGGGMQARKGHKRGSRKQKRRSARRGRKY